MVTELEHDIGSAGPASEDDNLLPLEVLRMPVVMAVDDLPGEELNAGDIGDDGNRVVTIADHHRIIGLNPLGLQT